MTLKRRLRGAGDVEVIPVADVAVGVVQTQPRQTQGELQAGPAPGLPDQRHATREVRVDGHPAHLPACHVQVRHGPVTVETPPQVDPLGIGLGGRAEDLRRGVDLVHPEDCGTLRRRGVQPTCGGKQGTEDRDDAVPQKDGHDPGRRRACRSDDGSPKRHRKRGVF